MSDNVQGSAKFAGSHLNDNKHINVEVELVFFPLEQVLTIAGAIFFFKKQTRPMCACLYRSKDFTEEQQLGCLRGG